MQNGDELPWYMTISGMICGLFLAFFTWSVCLVAGMMLLGEPGVLLGHIGGCVCAFTGIPQRWILG